MQKISVNEIAFPFILPNRPKHSGLVIGFLLLHHFGSGVERALNVNKFLSPKHSLGSVGDVYCKAIIALVIHN